MAKYQKKIRIEKILFHKLMFFYKKQWFFTQDNNSCFPIDLFYLARKNNPLSFFRYIDLSESINEMVHLYELLRLHFETAMLESGMSEDKVSDWLFENFMCLDISEFPGNMYLYKSIEEFKKNTYQFLPQLVEVCLDEVWNVADEMLCNMKIIPKSCIIEFWDSVIFNFIFEGVWSAGEATMIVLHCPIFNDWVNYEKNHEIKDCELVQRMKYLSQIFVNDFIILESRFESDLHIEYFQDMDIRIQFLLAEIEEIFLLLKKKYKFTKRRRQRLNSPFDEEVEEVFI